MDSQDEDSPGREPLQGCCAEWILKVRTAQVENLFRTVRRMDSQGEDSPCGAPLQDWCTEWILKVRTDLVEHLFGTAAQNGFSR
jgi:hypothetical protein